MEEILRNFARQLAWKPTIAHEDALVRTPRMLVCGMGGSRLAGDLLRTALPARDIGIHADFSLPPYLGRETLVVASSYSGNTEETLNAFRAAREKNLPLAVIGAGGTLFDEARRARVPVVEIPEKNLPPRLAIGYGIRALLALLGDEHALAETASISLSDALAEEGKKLAENMKDAVPLIYTSHRMGGLAYYWKVMLNETAKVPAFANTFPEAGHNEIEGFENIPRARFACIALSDPDDDPRVAQRLRIFARLCREKEILIFPLALAGANVWERLFRSAMLANWTAFHLAKLRGANPDATPLIDAWKRELRES